MQKYLLPLIAVLAILAVTTYYLSSSDDRAYYEALSNFIYIDDIADEHKAFTRIDSEFQGDCEDFAFTLQLQIGGEVWAFTHNDNVNHDGRHDHHSWSKLLVLSMSSSSPPSWSLSSSLSNSLFYECFFFREMFHGGILR